MLGPRYVAATEACGRAYRWTREMDRLGYEVKPIAPRHAKPSIERHESGPANREAIAERLFRHDTRLAGPGTPQHLARGEIPDLDRT